MLFHSGVFLQFFAAFLLLHSLARRQVAWRNRLVVAASWTFYAWWDWRFLGLLVGSSLLDYGLARAIEAAPDERARRRWLWASVAGNLGVLGVFKYAGFFVDSLARGLAALGWEPDLPTLRFVLPVGISFYTFQSLSYVIDVHRRRLPASRDPVAFLAYVAFFPQLVAGPIERAGHLLPQFATVRPAGSDGLAAGLWLLLRGYFKKVFVADPCGAVADIAFGQSTPTAAGTLIGVAAFGLQVYGDFGGYSDIARGLARWLGFDLMVNFDRPYLARSLRDFWHRWHISLSGWLRDYVYIPLGGNRRGPARTAIHLVLTFLLAGLWHGASWHFVAWGAWHGLALVAERRLGLDHPTGPVARWAGWLLTLALVGYGWLLFRAVSLSQAVDMTRSLVRLDAPAWAADALVNLLWFGLPLAALEVWEHRRGSLETRAPAWPAALQATVGGVLLFAILRYWPAGETPFLYFQF